MPEGFAIAQVTPFAWEQRHEVNEEIAHLSQDLAARGHRVVIVAPSTSAAAVRDGRKLIRQGADRLLEQAEGEPVVLAVSESLGGLPWRRRLNLPSDVTRTLGDLFDETPFDICHVHEPFAPGLSSAALRSSRTLNVGSFHAPTERLVSTQVARRVVQPPFGRLDARTASWQETARVMERHFPAEYRLVLPGAPALERIGDASGSRPLRIAFADEEERPALRLLLRALRLVECDEDWELLVRSEHGPSSTPLRASLSERVHYANPDEVSTDELIAASDIMVAASSGTEPEPGILARASAGGSVPVASRLPIYAEVLDEGERGLLFEPKDATVLAAQLSRLLSDASLRRRLADAAVVREWSSVTDEFEEIYEEVVARRKPAEGNAAIARRLEGRPTIDVDLHMHTDHSHDCATPVETLLETARDKGLGAIAITEHNEISGAKAAAEIADAYGVKVILAEEVKTADQGEVIGLFIKEKIDRGMTLAETVAEIKRQGGLVYVPHPFDRMHSVPDYENLLSIVDDIDLIEVFNPRVAFDAFNEEAVRFAGKYRIPAAAGSDAHVAQGLGTARVRMRDFDGPEEFMESLRTAEIHTTPTNYVYVQALKFLQTRGGSGGGRNAKRSSAKAASRKG
ncbi:MAG: PHP domain-containing protein [Solirubrobacteraceae bacterium]|nr:PHP domain-containing protein [Solirubrobacteraceae bacterium]